MSAPSEQPTFVYPTTQTVYTLRFTGEVSRFDPDRFVRQEHVDEARVMVGDAHEWRDWLQSTTRDACEIDWKLRTGREVYPKEPEVFDIQVTLKPPKKKSKFDLDGWLEINGEVTWRGPEASELAMRQAVQWRIGDRMAYYGIRSVSDKGWMYIIRPGATSHAAHVEVTVGPGAPLPEEVRA